jgi:hypothetical protein
MGPFKDNASVQVFVSSRQHAKAFVHGSMTRAVTATMNIILLFKGVLYMIIPSFLPEQASQFHGRRGAVQRPSHDRSKRHG